MEFLFYGNEQRFTAIERLFTMPPRSPRLAARRRLKTAARATASNVYRDAILEAAEEEFSESGYAACKMIDVAHRAGMSVGALYRHFDNKEAIFVSLMERAALDVTARLDRATVDARDARDRLSRLIAENFAFIEENRAMFMVFQKMGDADRAACRVLHEESEHVRSRLFARYRAAIADGVASGALRDDISIDDQLSFLTGVVHGFLETWIRDDGELISKTDVVTRLILRALGGTP